MVERLGEIPWVIVSVNVCSGNYSLDFIPITGLPEEEFYPLSDRVLLSKDSAVPWKEQNWIGVRTKGRSSLYHLLDQSKLVAVVLSHITNTYNGLLKSDRRLTCKLLFLIGFVIVLLRKSQLLYQLS